MCTWQVVKMQLECGHNVLRISHCSCAAFMCSYKYCHYESSICERYKYKWHRGNILIPKLLRWDNVKRDQKWCAILHCIILVVIWLISLCFPLIVHNLSFSITKQNSWIPLTVQWSESYSFYRLCNWLPFHHLSCIYEFHLQKKPLMLRFWKAAHIHSISCTLILPSVLRFIL